MISTAILLVRTSLVRVLFLAAALMTLATVWSDAPPEPDDAEGGMAAALVPAPQPHAASGDPPPALRIALFDPERRPETIAGSIDDLRGAAAPPPLADITITGVLLDGRVRRAMLGVAGGATAWTALGADIGGWHLASIDAEGAVLERDGRSVALK
ncbi:hypothetical protein P7D22_11120, partial [Lichenihabitans sp. Uapishka_5]|nr:hypothetical protein [Lichenihabitans sp. Uapishka_5]